MNQTNTELYQQHLDILSFRDLSPDTIANYASYLNEYIGWTEETISGKDLHGYVALDEKIAFVVVVGMGRQSLKAPVGVVEYLEVGGEHVLSCVEG